MAALCARAWFVPPKPVPGIFTGGTGATVGGGTLVLPGPTTGTLVAVAVGFLVGFGVLVGTGGTGVAVGAKGVIYGRNVWQADDPAAISLQLREIIHG